MSPRSQREALKLEKYHSLVNGFEERLVDLLYDFKDGGTDIEYFRLPKVSQLLCIALRLFTTDEFPFLKESIDDYHDSLFVLLIKYVREHHRKDMLKDICTDAATALDVETEEPDELIALAVKKLEALDKEVRDCDDKMIEQTFEIQGIQPIISSTQTTSQSKELFQKACDGIQQSMQELRDMKSRACDQISQIKVLQESLNTLVRKEGHVGAAPKSESDLEKALVSIWNAFYNAVLGLNEPGSVPSLR